jgi:hypothetical protein
MTNLDTAASGSAPTAVAIAVTVTALRQQRAALARQLASGLLGQAPLAELQGTRDRIAMVDTALAAQTPHGSRWRGPALALLAVAAGVSVAALWPMPRVSFVVELEAGAAQLRMREAGTLGPQGLEGMLRAEGFDRIESGDPAWRRRAEANGASPLGLTAEGLSLRRIRFPAGATLGFEGDARTVRLSIEGAPSAARFELSGATSSSLGGAPREANRYAVAEWVELTSTSAPGALWFDRRADRRYVWRGLQPAALRLVERQPDADGQVRVGSALRRAVVRLPATGRELTLGSASGLELDGLQLEQSELALGEQVGMKLSGSAQRFVVSTGGFSESLKPSLLEYAARNHTLELLWSAAGVLWGVSSWLRKAAGGAL